MEGSSAKDRTGQAKKIEMYREHGLFFGRLIDSRSVIPVL